MNLSPLSTLFQTQTPSSQLRTEVSCSNFSQTVNRMIGFGRILHIQCSQTSHVCVPAHVHTHCNCNDVIVNNLTFTLVWLCSCQSIFLSINLNFLFFIILFYFFNNSWHNLNIFNISVNKTLIAIVFIAHSILITLIHRP